MFYYFSRFPQLLIGDKEVSILIISHPNMKQGISKTTIILIYYKKYDSTIHK